MMKGLCAALMLLVMTGCIRGRLERPPQKQVFTFTHNVPKSTMKELVVGDELKFILTENSTTGYTWILEPEMKNVVTRLEHQPADSKLVGAPGKAIAVFAPKKSGEYVFVLKHQRPWESVPVEKMTVTLKVY